MCMCVMFVLFSSFVLCLSFDSFLCVFVGWFVFMVAAPTCQLLDIADCGFVWHEIMYVHTCTEVCTQVYAAHMRLGARHCLRMRV